MRYGIGALLQEGAVFSNRHEETANTNIPHTSTQTTWAGTVSATQPRRSLTLPGQ
jgi:hypothetical protein